MNFKFLFFLLEHVLEFGSFENLLEHVLDVLEGKKTCLNKPMVT
jgi:hypothetical protein